MFSPLCQALYSGLSQLAVGGRLIFYTDSMNPIENEAILYTVITQQRGRFDIKNVVQVLYLERLTFFKRLEY
jgi:16S rRNA C967 or C1407 C5-methylase (RsmB/RsmF family)